MTTPGGDGSPRDKVVSLHSQPIVAPASPKPSPPGALHGMAIAGMALCAFVGIFSLLALITVEWTGDSKRFVLGLFIASGFGLLLCSCLAVFSAARDTYARNGRPASANEED